MDKLELENRFTYHAPKAGQPEIYNAIRQKAKELTALIEDSVPESREKALAFTNLEQGIFWANAAVARRS